MATPPTEPRSGTPACIIASEPPQTEAIDEEPLDSRMSETIRIAYANSSSGGRSGASARRARFPWPISRRAGPRRNFTSPTENGGKRSEEHTSELQSLAYLVCRLLLEKKKKSINRPISGENKHPPSRHTWGGTALSSTLLPPYLLTSGYSHPLIVAFSQIGEFSVASNL